MLEKVPGVETVDVDFKAKTATVKARGVAAGDLAAAVNAFEKGRFQAAVKP